MQYIKITPEQQQTILEKFKNFLSNGRFSDNKIKFDEPLDKVLDTKVIKPIIQFTAVAWLKMRQLVTEADGEIGWHGVVDHQPNSAVYTIKDILVYPQTVTGATVTTDELEYGTWLQKFPDPIFNKIRFQGHSHVNMGTSPSGVDQHFYDSILQTLQEGDYYIFLIANKRSDMTIFVYDYAQNIIFNEKDCTLQVVDKHGSIKQWAEQEMKANVKKYTYTHSITPTGKIITTPTVPTGTYHRPVSINPNIRPEEMTVEQYYERFGHDLEEPVIDKDRYPYLYAETKLAAEQEKEKRGPGRPTKEETLKEAREAKTAGTDFHGNWYINKKGKKVYF